MSSFLTCSSLDEVEKMVHKEPIEEFYDVGPELGRGKFAIVRRCTEKSSGLQFAAKYLRKRRGGKSCRPDIMMEVDIVRQCMHHHRIVKLHEVFESTREMIIVLELASGGELFKLIAVDPIPENQAREIVWQLLEGVSHLHSFNVVHLDLKPENILLQRKGSLDIKIADFGLAIQLTPGKQVRNLVGTAEYVAPEILNYEPLSIASDMWSIGALTYALLTGYSPFQGDTHQDTFLNVSMGEYDFEDEVFEEVSQDAKDFIEDLLRLKPGKRNSAAQCLNHPWIKSRNSVAQSHEVLNSSTSSLDSALCLDSASSLDPSPISSASSSFAPRPSGTKGAAADDDTKMEDMKRQLSEKMSKLCTETAKAVEVDEGLSSSAPLDGSVSSVSSTESIRTLVPPEDDASANKVSYDTDKHSITPVESSRSAPVSIPEYSSVSPRSGYRDRYTSSGSTAGEEDERSSSRAGSRPGSALRNFSGDLTSLAPETLDKLKRYEELKQRRKDQFSSSPSSKKSEKTDSDSDGSRKIPLFEKDRLAPKRGSLNRSSSDTSSDSSFRKNDTQTPEKEMRAKTEPASSPQVQDKSANTMQDDKLDCVTNRSPPPSTEKSDLASMTSSNEPPTRNSLSLSSAVSDSSSSNSTHREEQLADVELRRPGLKHVMNRPSWRQTPLIDPDAIEAILRGEVSEDDLGEAAVSTHKRQSHLETFQEEDEPPFVNRALRRNQRSTSYSPRSSQPNFIARASGVNTVSPTKERLNNPILKHSGQSDLKEGSSSSSPMRKRVMIISSSSSSVSNSASRNNRASSEDLLTTDYLKVPPEGKTLKDTRVSNLQSSLTMSRSTPDLSALLTGSMKVARRSTRNEESYVTGSSSTTGTSRRSPSTSRSSSVRNSLFGSSSLVRRFTISGDKTGRKTSPKNSPSKFSSKNASKMY